MNLRRPTPDAQALLLALLLLVLPLRRGLAEDFFDFKSYYYKEDGTRVKSWGPSFQGELDLNADTTLRIGGVFDVISGATPTGAPPVQKTRPEVILVPVGTAAGGGGATTTTTVVSGASGRSSTVTTTAAGGAAAATPAAPKFMKETIQVPYGPHILPMAFFNDQRVAFDAELSRRMFGDYILTAGAAISNESDYNSLAGSLKLDREFNNKNTIATIAFSGTHDLVKDVATGGNWNTKNSFDYLAGLSQVLDKNTVLTINYTFGTQSGYLDDQYKLASVAGSVISEHRPHFRGKDVIDAVLNHYFDFLNAGLELDYRYYHDSYDINANSYGLKWNQKVGSQIIVSPELRYYEQSAASFYAPIFVTTPQYYSADYRLSNLSTLSYGLTVTWKPRPKFAVDAGYERYTMYGRDGVTPAANYPNANMFTVGFKIWF